MKLQSLTLLAAAVLACTACKNDIEAEAADASPMAADAAMPADTAAGAPAAAAAPVPPPPGEAAGTWTYAEEGGKRTASIAGRAGGAQLVFSDDPVWGRGAYVEFAQDDINCPTGCKAQLSIDGGAAKTVSASRPETPQPRLALREPLELWQSIAGAGTLSIEYPSKSGTGKVEFDVAGADAGKLPGWK
ncbi:hypothetical protein [Luteimonas aquatica]|uniref:hypothetical protein n=1 Tax=Luteimonas aquatica TaxID=450364 RepID=UPI001F569076|nr:hypothetical protein [Luteimonas aquatica]